MARWFGINPRTLSIPVIFVVTMAAVVLVDLTQYQLSLWVAAVVLFGGGDTVTTGLLGRFNLHESPGWTRRVCGAEPSMACAAATRALILVGAGVVYLIFLYGLGAVFAPAEVWAVSVPLILVVGGATAVIFNGYAMIRQMAE